MSAVHDHDAAPEEPRVRGLAHRCVMAAAVGALLGLVWLALMGTASLNAAVSRAELAGAAILFFVLPLVALLAWPLLRITGVRPAWLVALVAPAPVVAVWHLLDVLWL